MFAVRFCFAFLDVIIFFFCYMRGWKLSKPNSIKTPIYKYEDNLQLFIYTIPIFLLSFSSPLIYYLSFSSPLICYSLSPMLIPSPSPWP